jgi:hypothetical protein
LTGLTGFFGLFLFLPSLKEGRKLNPALTLEKRDSISKLYAMALSFILVMHPV